MSEFDISFSLPTWAVITLAVLVFASLPLSLIKTYLDWRIEKLRRGKDS